jgi:Spy/CpxP family protein refolding chaperone
MKRRKGAIARTAIAAVCLAASLAVPVRAQGRGGPPGGGMGGPGMGGPQFPNAGPGNGGPGIGGEHNQPRAQSGDSRAGLVLGPPGVRWWDDHSFAKSMKLRPDQQMKMDSIFEQNRSALITSFEGVRVAEAQMEQLSRAASPDEAALFAQIDRVAQARAELAKSTTHMFLQIRKEMDPDQIKRLEKATQR